MKKVLLTFLLAIGFFLFSNEDPAPKNKPVTVKVLLTKLTDEALLEVRGRYFLYNPRNDSWIANGTKSKRARIATSENGLFWGEEMPNTFELRIVPAQINSAILVNGIQYNGCIEVYSIGGTLNVVNEVDAESYLKSILAPQFETAPSKEVLDAVVITERTNLYHLIQKDPYASWQIEGEKVGYKGQALAKHNRWAQESIERTRELVLHYNDQPFAATWSHNNAGKSVSYPSIFRIKETVPEGVRHLPSLHRREKSKWKTTVPLATLTKMIHLKNITRIDLFKAEKTSKVYALRFREENKTQDIDFFTLQKNLGKKLLPSNDFTITLQGKKAIFTGYGKGEGVGLCLLSAEILAKRHQGTEKILLTHFPGAKLIYPTWY